MKYARGLGSRFTVQRDRNTLVEFQRRDDVVYYVVLSTQHNEVGLVVEITG